MTPIRLRVIVRGASKEDVTDRCWQQAGEFFGTEHHHLDMPIDVEVEAEASAFAGKPLAITYEATGYFVNYGDPEPDYSGLL